MRDVSFHLTYICDHIRLHATTAEITSTQTGLMKTVTNSLPCEEFALLLFTFRVTHKVVLLEKLKVQNRMPEILSDFNLSAQRR